MLLVIYLDKKSSQIPPQYLTTFFIFYQAAIASNQALEYKLSVVKSC